MVRSAEFERETAHQCAPPHSARSIAVAAAGDKPLFSPCAGHLEGNVFVNGGVEVNDFASGGSDADTLTTDTAQLTLAGALVFEGGSGTNTVTLATASLTSAHGTVRLGKLASGESLRFIGGNDGDTFTTDAAVFTAPGGVTFDGRGGTNQFLFNGFTSTVSLGKLGTGHSIDYSGDSGDDRVSFGAGTLLAAGGIEMNAGKGANELILTGDEIRKLGPLATGQSIKFVDSSDTGSVSLGGRFHRRRPGHSARRRDGGRSDGADQEPPGP